MSLDEKFQNMDLTQTVDSAQVGKKCVDISRVIEIDHIINELASIAYETTSTMAPELDLDDMDPGTWRVVAVNVLKKFAELTN